MINYRALAPSPPVYVCARISFIERTVNVVKFLSVFLSGWFETLLMCVCVGGRDLNFHWLKQRSNLLYSTPWDCIYLLCSLETTLSYRYRSERPDNARTRLPVFKIILWPKKCTLRCSDVPEIIRWRSTFDTWIQITDSRDSFTFQWVPIYFTDCIMHIGLNTLFSEYKSILVHGYEQLNRKNYNKIYWNTII